MYVFKIDGVCVVHHLGSRFLNSRDPPAAVSQVAGIAGVLHCTCLKTLFLNKFQRGRYEDLCT
jgi:hypothetical protein